MVAGVGCAGVRGYPGKSKAGELSIIPTRIALLAPCLPNLPLPSRNAADLALRDTVSGIMRGAVVSRVAR